MQQGALTATRYRIACMRCTMSTACTADCSTIAAWNKALERPCRLRGADGGACGGSVLRPCGADRAPRAPGGWPEALLPRQALGGPAVQPGGRPILCLHVLMDLIAAPPMPVLQCLVSSKDRVSRDVGWYRDVHVCVLPLLPGRPSTHPEIPCYRSRRDWYEARMAAAGGGAETSSLSTAFLHIACSGRQDWCVWPDQALRVLDNAMDTIIDAPQDAKSGWSLLERDASGGWAMRLFAHIVYGLRKVLPPN